ncbi:uncharacterized protein LOC114016566 [Falco cherrug]|nr:uncharacterized protein LOC114016566 [Falco cherrug]
MAKFLPRGMRLPAMLCAVRVCKTGSRSLHLPQTGGDEGWHKPFLLLLKLFQIISKIYILQAWGKQAGSSASPAEPCECRVSACVPATQKDAVPVVRKNCLLLQLRGELLQQSLGNTAATESPLREKILLVVLLGARHWHTVTSLETSSPFIWTVHRWSWPGGCSANRNGCVVAAPWGEFNSTRKSKEHTVSPQQHDSRQPDRILACCLSALGA